MRMFTVLFLLVAFTASISSAELLTTANTAGQGNWVVEGFGVQDQNLMNQNGWSLTTVGGYVGYGLLEQLDVFINYGSATGSGLPTGMAINAAGYGLSAKYGILKEGEAMPVSVAAAVQYKTSTQKVTGLPDSIVTQLAGGIGISKIIVPFIPYAALGYRTNAADGTEQNTQIDITAGTAIAWSEQGAVLIEYTNQAITGKAAGNVDHTSGQIAIGVGYKI